MSKLTFLSACLLAATAALSLTAPASAGTPLPNGDVNDDGVANAIDAALVLQYSAGLLPSVIIAEGNVNFDDQVNSVDAALILQYGAGLVPQLPYLPMPPMDGEPTVTASGLGIYDFRTGTGTLVMPGATVTVNYTGWFEDGKPFDAGHAEQFPLGAVIEGWREGVPGMRVGGERRLIIPPELAYVRRVPATSSHPTLPSSSISSSSPSRRTPTATPRVTSP
jgi:hypothetical protein